jgi:hypothetical protein
MCNILGIEKTRTTVMHPQSDGMVERYNRTIGHMLASFVAKHQRNWDEYIPMLLMAYRSSTHETTGVSPCKMMFGREINLPIDLLLGKPESQKYQSATEFAYELENRIDEIHDFAREHMQNSSKRMKRNYDHNIFNNNYSKGDKVWYYKAERRPGLYPKFQRPWIGPITIIDRINDVLYRIKIGPKSKPRVVHHNKLKPYRGDN